jgi:DNA processing protein
MPNNGLIFLNLIKSLTPKKCADILSYFGDSEEVLNASPKAFSEIHSLSEKDKDAILKVRASDALEKELRLIEKQKIKIIGLFDDDYPKLLKEISHPPLILYVKGNSAIFDKFLFAIVGTRLPTLYGISLAEEFSYKLAALGIVIVSGLARGIDTASHKGALRTGDTLAVLGSGIDNIYPRQNYKLAEQIAENGAVISEFALGTPPLKENFPRRNRIVSGLCRGVLVVEAASRSGALITAHYALEQNREVFALPGKVDSALSKGTHLLIKEGAKLVESVKDILEELNIEFKTQSAIALNLNPAEQKILEIVAKSGSYLEEIILKSKIEQALATKTVLDLQLKGLIEEIRPSCFIKI